jgi:hypothetical protein
VALLARIYGGVIFVSCFELLSGLYGCCCLCLWSCSGLIDSLVRVPIVFTTFISIPSEYVSHICSPTAPMFPAHPLPPQNLP